MEKVSASQTLGRGIDPHTGHDHELPYDTPVLVGSRKRE